MSVNIGSTAQEILNEINDKVRKTTYEATAELACGSNGKVCLGKFGAYDTNITIELNSTTSTTYHATIVIHSQNVVANGTGGSVGCNVYGDADNHITPLISVFRPYGSANRQIEVYADLPGWSKNLVHIQGVAISTGGMTDVLTSVNSIPTAIDGKIKVAPINVLVANYAPIGNYVTLDTEQTITGKKHFKTGSGYSTPELATMFFGPSETTGFAFGNDGMQTFSNGSYSTMYINYYGGNVDIGRSGSKAVINLFGTVKENGAALSSKYASLDSSGKVPASQLPSYVDDVLEYSAKSSFPAAGEAGKVYVDTSTNITYRWSGSAYVAIGSDLALGETSATAYRGDRGKTAYDHSQETSGNPHGVTKSDVGLGSVENKSSATIRSEITKANVTNALGYTPPEKPSLHYVTSLTVKDAGSSTSGAYLATKWAVSGVDGITAPTDGMTLSVRVPAAGVSGGILLSIDGGTTYYPIVRNVNSLATTHYGKGASLILTFNSTQTAKPYTASGVTTTVTGCWQVADYDSNTRNTVGDYRKNGTKLYFVGTTSSDSATSSSYATSYTNSNCYVGTDNCVYSGGSKTATVGMFSLSGTTLTITTS